MARPHISADGAIECDGKIGIFPFTTQKPAMRNSKHRVKVTLETKPIHYVIKSVINQPGDQDEHLFEFILNKLSKFILIMAILQVIPTIKNDWPKTINRHNLIQQDNAKSHLKHDDLEFMAVTNSDGYNIKLVCQPVNSPNTNVNDLGFFRVIQSLQTDKHAMDMDDLPSNAITSFEEQSASTLNNVFLTLQDCLIEIMKEKGMNNYKISHMNKGRLIDLRLFPESLEVEERVIKGYLDYLKQLENDVGSKYDLEPLMKALVIRDKA